MEIKFWDELSLKVLSLYGNAVWCIVDEATHFSAAFFVDARVAKFSESNARIGLIFTATWFSNYTGFPDELILDQGVAPTCERWKLLDYTTETQVRISVTGAQRYLGILKRLQDTLQQVFNEFKEGYLMACRDIMLEIAVKATNGTVDENGPVPY